MTHDDALYSRAVDLVILTQSASVSMLQRSLQIGFSQAAGYLDEMEVLGIVSAANLIGGRTVLIKDPPVGSVTVSQQEQADSTRRSAAPK